MLVASSSAFCNNHCFYMIAKGIILGHDSAVRAVTEVSLDTDNRTRRHKADCTGRGEGTDEDNELRMQLRERSINQAGLPESVDLDLHNGRSGRKQCGAGHRLCLEKLREFCS
ncbi:hypothetical protein RRG08_032620 [Elysia crispata]|uniref:Uncharacterized protein n=1 Tax=Elysia crispata TaxID=231223 RepID=A0AAE0Y052_9GAST|nr:hypothetical protein RRG08_032620 [Elysia crispata]